ncbi:Homoserine dehydrogenase [Ignisphaera aggregans DSM 17230]|uniref:Homoserine dehydrogenase n=1 Tax=Ignisphaera aggregans (strain DSM 17230 / JCM 13409 / AQ1.S1) TaxID=583356 RepID=E0SS98_IGNAA|nr:Homoserine dehydrogenase [Ignisphaera aggregans DSM 17230]
MVIESNRKVNVAIIGFGSVGRALARVLALKRRDIYNRYGINISIVAIVDSKGMAIKPEGFDEYELLKLSELPRSSVNMFKPYAVDGVDLEKLYNTVTPDIHVELTPSDYSTGKPGVDNVFFAISRGAHLVLANKAPLVLKFRELIDKAKSRGLEVRFRATVLGGTPFIDTLMSMKSYEIDRIEGIINATTNFILTEMHDKLIEFSEALKIAQALGIAEANPSLDIDGIDAAAKLVIISNIVGTPIKLEDVYRESLSRITLRDIVDAIKQGFVIKYIATLNIRERSASVRIARVPRNDIFAQINGTLNGLRIKTNVAELIFIGKGGGGIETAHSVLDDIISIAQKVVGSR